MEHEITLLYELWTYTFMCVYLSGKSVRYIERW